MLRLAVGLLVVALVAGPVGFVALAITSAGIAKAVVFVLLLGFLVSLVFKIASGRRVPWHSSEEPHDGDQAGADHS